MASEDRVVPHSSLRADQPAITGPSAYKRWREALKRMQAYPANHEGRVLYLKEFEAVMIDWRTERRAIKRLLNGR